MNPATLAPTPAQREADRHRPDRAVLLRQRWEKLLFLHWRWDAAEVQATLPPGLTVDTWDRVAWLALTPLFMREVHPRFVPAAVAANFLELNLRTYCYDARGRPGVYFYSLDCDQPFAVEAAQRLLDLPYRHARMESHVDQDDVVDFHLLPEAGAELNRYRYQSLGAGAEASPESLEYFLLERYRLFTSDETEQSLRTIQVAHAPLQWSEALVRAWDGGPLERAGFAVGHRHYDHACMVNAVDVDTFGPERVG